MLIRHVVEYRAQDVNASLKRNEHMHHWRGEELPPDAVDAILVGVLNFIAGKQGIDLALFASDLDEKSMQLSA